MLKYDHCDNTSYQKQFINLEYVSITWDLKVLTNTRCISNGYIDYFNPEYNQSFATGLKGVQLCLRMDIVI